MGAGSVATSAERNRVRMSGDHTIVSTKYLMPVAAAAVTRRGSKPTVGTWQRRQALNRDGRLGNPEWLQEVLKRCRAYWRRSAWRLPHHRGRRDTGRHGRTGSAGAELAGFVSLHAMTVRRSTVTFAPVRVFPFFSSTGFTALPGRWLNHVSGVTHQRESQGTACRTPTRERERRRSRRVCNG